MKRFSLASLFVIIALVTSLAVPGCATAPSVATATTIQAVAHEAAYVGTSLTLSAKPELRPAFAVAEQALNAMVTGGVFDSAAFEQAIANLPVDIFHGETGAILNGAILTVYSVVLGYIDIRNAPAWVKPLVVGTRDGLEQALGAQPILQGARGRVFVPCKLPPRK